MSIGGIDPTKDVNDDALRSLLCNEISGLSEAIATGDDWRVIRLLREFVYHQVNWGNDGLQTKRWLPQGGVAAHPIDLLRLLRAQEISMLCGATSIFLSKTYSVFGYDSSVYNYGIRNVSAHVTTVVDVQQNKESILSIQDGTSNFSMRANGSFDIVSILTSIIKKRYNLVDVLKGKINERYVFFNPNDDRTMEDIQYYKSTGTLTDKLRSGKSELINSDYFYAKADLDFHTSYCRRREVNVLSKISSLTGLPVNKCNILQLMLFPIELPRLSSSLARSKVSWMNKNLFKLV